uniref:t-SNARE coiled-coil homology domain-containing protein n=1 Tax=Paramoeba aestuarina TaxID=180227 RepID=A0A7S4KE43_9EUKA|mmetsp:Transcript_17621/g.27580  ORF Transcript_17621/g.27580 Transcript_17621/m.27580 type:complete len:317 (+) Transcript_17621:99-1049(+)|eukprot:CAMPEP_0201508636 /NCGR_PEP_ID=MMETSP0161_2-20130828/1941_1 /ASSEMBLY_ACC=CAM_ASM_000251 /TAXON_ID=180227 /ORGANISM="Neoparamoeba aestuarina, Strain SoJaBio B1-5/56/2" /LENGTH=316 /DNA_ID=CAMNT_0047903365 /DNA_START=88 /DNA_END=1038 /DNA_ORIENTATION=-
MPVKDRMAEFNQAAPPAEKINHQLEIDEEDEEDDEEEEEEDEDMEEFYADVSDIKRGLISFKENIDELDVLTTEQIAKGKGGQGGEKVELDQKMSETNHLANILRNKLKKMKQDINDLNQEDPSANIRIRVNIQQTLTRRFLDLMQQYQAVQTAFETNFRSKMRRQIEIVHPEKHPDEIDEMITRGEVGSLMQDQVLENRREHSEAAMALVHLKEQHRDIMLLEQNILELHQIFVDIATLVDAQEGLVDQIEWNCEQACAWTGEAVKELKKANLYVKKDRKRCCGCCACGSAACATCAGGAAAFLAFAPLAACEIM